MVELLAVIALLAIVMLIAIPTFGSIQSRTNQSIYESKIASVKAAAESYSEETGVMAYDIATLISQGKLEADNESGEYRNPVDGQDMRCYAVEVRYENMQYYASVHETNRC
ncbi:MAG: prepilin-type N-terminal cleavage/methylation domain-containing protein, partial [Bacilli bacterium]|nr:prepilin-type N-terminal cleavage/methylation domain-containing protein [Bacilli bacterium]